MLSILPVRSYLMKSRVKSKEWVSNDEIFRLWQGDISGSEMLEAFVWHKFCHILLCLTV